MLCDLKPKLRKRPQKLLWDRNQELRDGDQSSLFTCMRK